MSRTFFARLLFVSLFALAGCGGSETSSNNGALDVSDVGADATDTSGRDASDTSDTSDTSDASDDSDVSDVSDASDTTADIGDGEVPLSGFGAISGPCGLLDDELTSSSPWYIETHLDFGTDPYDSTDESLLTDGGREILADGNAGGSSLMSEVFAYEMLYRCELATLLKTETEVAYTTTDTSITDLLVEIDSLKIGVSVTRAVGWPREDPYTVQQATDLLTGKLEDIQESSANVAAEDAWTKQILYVIAYAPGHASSLATAYGGLDASVKADTIVLVTVSDGDDLFLYD